MDKSPHFLQKYVMRLLFHTHYNDFPHPGLVGQETEPNKDIFLSPPLMERNTDPAYQYLTGSHQLALTSNTPQTQEPMDQTGSQRPRPGNLPGVQPNFPGGPGGFMKTQAGPPPMVGMSGPGSVSSNDGMTPTFLSPTQPMPPTGMHMGMGMPSGMGMHGMGMMDSGRGGPGPLESPSGKSGRGRRRSTTSGALAK